MQGSPNISDAEWEVMRFCWSKSTPCTANEIVNGLEYTDWKANTIKTLIGRLVKKEALGFKEEGRIHLYYPIVTEKQCIKAESKSFINKVFGGAVKPMLVNFLKEEQLSQDEIEELKKILEDRRR